MKKFLVACLSIILSAVVFVPHRGAYSQESQKARRPYIDGEVIIKLKASVTDFPDLGQIPEQILRANARMVEPLTRRPRGPQLVHLDGELSVEEAVRRARLDPRVEYAEPNYFMYTNDTTPNDPLLDQMWGLSNTACTGCSNDWSKPDISALRAWDLTTGANDIVVGVIDTGIDVSHPDLAPNIWVNPGEIPDNKNDDDGNGYVDDINGWNFADDSNDVFVRPEFDTHATHVAGIIGAAGNNNRGVVGVAWNVKIVSLKFLTGSQGSGSTSNAVRAIEYAIDLKNRGVSLHVLNASWGGPGNSTALRDAVFAAGEAGILFVASAGNEANFVDETPSYPGAWSSDMSNVISVAAMSATDSLANFSNYGHNRVSVAAPGVDIWSTLPNNNYGPRQGTSMAAPFVSGIAALVYSLDRSLSPAEVKHRIISTSEPTPSVVNKVRGSGRVNAYNALTNQLVPPGRPVIVRAEIKKKKITIEGYGFLNGSSILEVDGQPFAGTEYDTSYELANGTLTRLVISPGKKPIKKAFPKNELVPITIFNQTTGERSERFQAARF
jgi:subtilisin family serine protease